MKMMQGKDDIIEQIMTIHLADDIAVIKADDLLLKVQQILRYTNLTSLQEPNAFNDREEEKDKESIPEDVQLTIHKIGCKMSCNWTGEEDQVDATILEVFKEVAKYPWEAKVALALSAFSVRYGEICFASHLCATNHLARSMILLKPLTPDVSEHEYIMSNLLEKVIDVTKIMVELGDHVLDSSTIRSCLAVSAYWSIKSIVACASQCIVANSGYEYLSSRTKARKNLLDLTQMINKILEQLTHHLYVFV